MSLSLHVEEPGTVTTPTFTALTDGGRCGRAVASALLALLALCGGCASRTLRAPYRDLLLAFPGATKECSPGGCAVGLVQCGGLPKSAVRIDPGGSVVYRLRLPRAARFHADVGVDDSVLGKSDGMEFRVEILAGDRARPRELARVRVPASDPAQQRWHSLDIDLSAWAGQDVALALKAGAGGKPESDTGGFAVPQVVGKPEVGPDRRWRGRPAILFSLDTLRVDRVGAFGGRTSSRRHLDREVRASRLYPEARSTSTWTLPAHMSMLSGTDPDVHQVEHSRLPATLPTLAEQLHAAGYRTGGFVADVGWLKPDYGFDRGFDVYLATAEPARSRIRRVREFCEAEDERPLFLFVHLFDAHSDFGMDPYEASPEEQWRSAPLAPIVPRCIGRACNSVALAELVKAHGRHAHEVELGLRQMYEAGLSDLDREVGRLRCELRAIGLWDRAFHVLVSDHGEEFGDHGSYMHKQMYGEVTRVLLAMRGPGRRGGGLGRGMASLSDVAPTLLSATVKARPPAAWQGSDLLRAQPAQAYGANGLGAAMYDESSVVMAPADGSAVGYDLSRDPAEAHPIRGVDGWPLARLLKARQADNARRARDLGEAPAAAPLSAEERARLRALGYNQ